MSKKTYHHGNLRQALLAAALEILSRDGIDNLSLRKVAQQAGVSATAPYSHFRDKSELLAVLAAQGFDQLADSMEREVAGDDDAASGGGLVGLARGYVDFATHRPALFQLMFGSGVGDLLELPELAQASARAFALIETAVAARMEQAGTPQRTPIAVAGAWSLVHGLSTLVNDGRIAANDCGVAENKVLIEQVCDLLSF